MEIAVLSTLLNEVGFPIAACVALFYLNRDATKQYRELMTQFKSAIDENTKAIHDMIIEFKKGE
jgi:uridine phosphorylase